MHWLVDRFSLLACGLLCAALSWAYFAWAQQQAFTGPLGLLVLGLWQENRMLRRQLQAAQAAPSQPRQDSEPPPGR